MTSMAAGLAAAFAGAVALNASYLLQHAGTRDRPALDLRRPRRSAAVLLGSPRWLAGLAAGMAGWALFVAGLAAAPLSLVQAFAAGVLYGTADAAAKAVVIDAGHGLPGALLGPWAAIVAVATFGAFAAFQRGLQLGPAVPVIALMTAGTTVAGVLGGLLVFGDPLGAPALAALHLAAFAAAALAGLVLAAAQARIAPEEAGLPRGGPPERTVRARRALDARPL